MSDLTLFQIAGAYRQLAEKLADADFDLATIRDTLESSELSDAMQTKAQNVEFVARAAESHIPTIDAEIARLQALKARRQQIAAGLRDYLREQMEIAGVQRIDSPLMTISLKKNPPAVEVFDEHSVPAKWWVTPPPKVQESRIDRKALAAALKAGQDVAGCRLTQGTRLEVS